MRWIVAVWFVVFCCLAAFGQKTVPRVFVPVIRIPTTASDFRINCRPGTTVQ